MNASGGHDLVGLDSSAIDPMALLTSLLPVHCPTSKPLKRKGVRTLRNFFVATSNALDFPGSKCGLNFVSRKPWTHSQSLWRRRRVWRFPLHTEGAEEVAFIFKTKHQVRIGGNPEYAGDRVGPCD